MSIESGHYIITNVKQRNVAFLTDSKDGTPIVGRHEPGTPGEQWDVQALSNGRYSIINLTHDRHAVARQCAVLGEKVEGRDDDQQWLIQETNTRGQYTIAAIDNGRVWGLWDNRMHTSITLFDPLGNRCHWTFKKAASDDVVAFNLQTAELKAERLAETTRREAAEADLARKVAELKAVKRDLEEARKLAGQETAKKREAEAEVAKGVEEVRQAKEEATQAKEEAAQAKEESFRTLTELEAARRDVAAAKAVAAEDAAKRKEAEAEASSKAAEADQAKREAAQAIEELARITGNPESSFVTTPKLDTGRYLITNVGAKTVATLASAKTGSCVAGGVERDSDTEKWTIVLLSNGKYTIQSLATHLYANHDPNPEEGESVTGSSRPRHWKIKAMQSPGQYVIFSPDVHCYWSLSDGGEGTLVAFSNQENIPNSQWHFTKLL